MTPLHFVHSRRHEVRGRRELRCRKDLFSIDGVHKYTFTEADAGDLPDVFISEEEEEEEVSDQEEEVVVQDQEKEEEAKVQDEEEQESLFPGGPALTKTQRMIQLIMTK